MRPTVSVLVPAYNDSPYLETALSSICEQTFGDFEVIVADDASTDDTVDVAQSFGARDNRFQVYRNSENLGMVRNWNLALARSSGYYIVKLDADDAFQPQALECLVRSFESYPAACAVFCRTISCDENMQPTASYLGERAFVLHGVEPLKERAETGWFWYKMSFDDYQIWHSNAFLVDRDMLMDMDGWSDCWGCAADTDFILRVLEKNRPVVHCPYPGVLYRRRPGSVSDKYRRANWLLAEGTAIHLRSLNRYVSVGGAVDLRLLKNWGRMWLNWERLKEEESVGVGYCGVSSAIDVARPPTRVLVPYRAIRLVSGLKRHIRTVLGRSGSRNPC